MTRPLFFADFAPASREVFWNISAPAQVFFYTAASAAMIVFCCGLFLRLRFWIALPLAAAVLRSFIRRMRAVWSTLIRRRRLSSDNSLHPGHGLVLIGFLALVFATLAVLADQHLFAVFHGAVYLIISAAADSGGILLLIGVLYFLYRRWTADLEHFGGSTIDLALLLALYLLVIQGYLVEGLRIRATSDAWALYSPVGLLFSRLFWMLSPSALHRLHFLLWWFHALTALIFVAILPYTRLFHFCSTALNLWLRDEAVSRRIQSPGNIQAMIEAAASGSELAALGIRVASDLDWRRRLELDACVDCGRCQQVCPAYAAGKQLSPREIVARLWREAFSFHLHSCRIPSLFRSLLLPTLPSGNCEAAPCFPKNGYGGCLAGSSAGHPSAAALSVQALWSCTTCLACTEVCPAGIDPLKLIVDMRRGETLLQSHLPEGTARLLRNLEIRGNPYGDNRSRLRWADGLSVPLLDNGEKVQVLYWVGCAAAFDPRISKAARAVVQILQQSGLSWGTIADRESCTGDAARRLGEERLFQQLAKRNIEALNRVSFDVLLTHCPHCYHAFEAEYGEINPVWQRRKFRIRHHGEFFAELAAQGRIKGFEPMGPDYVYHDPCYLSRYHGIIDAPRQLLRGSRKEMPHAGTASFCCGGGGGGYWHDSEAGGRRPGSLRIKEAQAAGAKLIVSACPFCLSTLEEDGKSASAQAPIAVRDLAEVIVDAAEKRAPVDK